ncbi:MAG: methyltransferase domain-containing protein [Halorubrum sp.]
MRTHDAAAFYSRYAGLYDRIATGTPFIGRFRERVVDALDPSWGDVVVEMGCGTGANLPYLRDRVGPGGVVIGVDVSPGVLARARERVGQTGWQNVHVVRADATRPPFHAAADAAGTGAGIDDHLESGISEVDAVVATFLTGMLSDPAAAVDDWCRLVADTERSGVATHGRQHRGRICVAGLARSTHPLGRLVNPAFAVGVGLAAPPSTGANGPRSSNRSRPSGRGSRPGGRREHESAVERLDRRALAAHAQVHDRCDDARTIRSFAGFARITAGAIPATDDTDTDTHDEH